MASKKLNIAIVGLGFGSEFVDIYRQHSDVGNITLCDRRQSRLRDQKASFGITRLANNLDEVLSDPEIDAVHLSTGIPDHARQTIQVLGAGKHCACAVPMATSISEIQAIIAAVHKSGKKYMMMETQIYTREFLHVNELARQGVFGRVQFLRGAHYQDMENWQPYWAGLPPMWYATHAVAPLLALTQKRAVKVHCFGSGHLREELHKSYENPFPIETAIFSLEGDEPLAMEVSRALFHSARAYTAAFTVYGEDAAFEWQQIEEEAPVLFRLSKLGEFPGARRSEAERISLPSFSHLLPAELIQFADGYNGGAYPHLVHEFVRSIVENRRPSIDEVAAANWTAPGICAHDSAIQGGAAVYIPQF
ncbi:Gfo/Idh/MocA family oxidoreductase [Mesorhizobium sp. M1006]|uniref:Gfo/Idh/MocA family protein n=1 Tax=Mesorhizobium sp. M1006 TaxID=2957048 RepID=UPI003337C09B